MLGPLRRLILKESVTYAFEAQAVCPMKEIPNIMKTMFIHDFAIVAI